MNCRCAALGISLGCLLTVASSVALAAEPINQPLRLNLATPVAHRASAPAMVANGNARGARFAQAEPSLRQRALQSVLTAQDAADEAPGSTDNTGGQFHFQRQGSAFRNLRRSYNNMCDNVSSKIWDEPNGRRIKFDSAGKPGVAVVIPLR